jgi:DNA-binding transcriptional regulator YiaG
MRLKRKQQRLQQPLIGELVRELRSTMQLSQEKFADALGMTFASINRWENGHATPSSLALKQIDTLLNQLSQSPHATLRERSEAMREKYFS